MADPNRSPASPFDPSWYTATWGQRAGFGSGCAAVLITLLKFAAALAEGPKPTLLTWLHLALAASFGYVLADLGSGLYHWAIDNYGSAQTPIFGPQIESFQAHHDHPAEIAKCETAGVLSTLAEVTAAAGLPVILFARSPAFLAFFGAFAGFGMFSLKFHAWAHTPRRKLPRVVAALQDAGVLLRLNEHTVHHRPPYNKYYCTVNGIWNRFLEEYKVIVAVETALFRLTGVKPRSWAE